MSVSCKRNNESNIEFAESYGYQARDIGEPKSTCPYSESDEEDELRIAWLRGWWMCERFWSNPENLR